MSGWYRELFGELPTATRAASLVGQRVTAEELQSVSERLNHTGGDA